MNDTAILKLLLLNTRGMPAAEAGLDTSIHTAGTDSTSGLMPRSTVSMLRSTVSMPTISKLRYFLNGIISFRLIEAPKGSSVEGIAMGQTEVTQELFEAVMGFNPSEFKDKPNSPQRPAETVTWYDCIMFCNSLSERLGLKPYYTIDEVEKNSYNNIIKSAEVTVIGGNGFRLPTEAEWLAFAKAGTENKWAGTSDRGKVKRVMWCDENSKNQTQPVAQLLPNEWGLYDMSGNVEEWGWDEKYGKARFVGSSIWSNSPEYMHIKDVGSYSPDSRYGTIGFRICRTIK
jgi:formylglycine-generating enzyme required for sulfatase activity